MLFKLKIKDTNSLNWIRIHVSEKTYKLFEHEFSHFEFLLYHSSVYSVFTIVITLFDFILSHNSCMFPLQNKTIRYLKAETFLCTSVSSQFMRYYYC